MTVATRARTWPRAARTWPRAARSLAGLLVLAGVLGLLAVLGPGVVRASEPGPEPAESTPATPAPTGWPTGDELRRDLQLIGYSFRVDRAAGEWSGWAPTFPLDRPPSVRLGVAGREPAWAAFQFDLLAVQARGIDIDAALTALLEVVARLPIPDADATRLHEFITADLLTRAVEQLEPCFATRLPDGVMVIRVEAETGLADLLLARTPGARDPGAGGAGTDISDCAPIRPTTLGPGPGALISVRLTVVATGGAEPALEPAFEPADSTVEGSVVTVVLTFRNQSAVEQTLTFREPVEADSGPVAPGEERLILVRRLEPGDYPFFSATDPTGMTGVLRVVPPPEEP